MGSGKSKPQRTRRDSGRCVKSRIIGIVKEGDWKQFYKPVDNGNLGSGMTGLVFVVKHTQSGKMFACKPLKKAGTSSDIVETMRREISLLAQLDHPNILKIVDAYEDEKNITAIMELLSGGSLFENLCKTTKQGCYTEKRAQDIFVQMVRAVNFVHSRGIAHRDLKLENFVFESKDDNAPLKLIDFGLSKKFLIDNKVLKMNRTVGTVYYMAPEIAKQLLEGTNKWSKSYTQTVDIWSLGVLLYMLLTGRTPFRGMSKGQYHYLSMAITGKVDFTRAVWKHLPKARDLVEKMLQVSPTKRLPLDQVLKHEWLEPVTSTPSTRAQMKATHELVCDFAKIGQVNAITRLTAQIAAFTIPSEAVEKLRSTFMQIDEDNSGMISFDEFQRAMKSTKMDEKKVKKIFKDMDIDDTGTIEYSEFISAALLATNAIAKEDLIDAFNKMDTDSDGAVSSKELLTVLKDYASEQEAKNMINDMEQHHTAEQDGKITRTEFMTAIWAKSGAMEEEVLSAEVSGKQSS